MSSSVGIGPVLGQEARLAGAAAGPQSGSQIGGAFPGALQGRDELASSIKRLTGKPNEIATEYRDLSGRFDAQIRRALRLPFAHECETFIALNKAVAELQRPDTNLQGLEGLRVQVSSLRVSSPQQFEKNIEAQRVLLYGNQLTPLEGVGENRHKVLELFGSFREIFDRERQAALGEIEKRIQAASGHACSVPRAETVVDNSSAGSTAAPEGVSGAGTKSESSRAQSGAASPADSVVITAGLSNRLEFPSPYKLSALVGEVTSAISDGFKAGVAVFLGGKANQAIALGEKETMTQPEVKMRLNDFQQFAFVQLPNSPVAPLYWLGGAEQLKDALIGSARGVFGNTSSEASKLRLDRGLVVIQDLGESRDDRRFLGRLFRREAHQVPSNYATLAVSIIPPDAIDKCGERFQRTDQRLFLVSMVTTMPKEQVKAAVAVLSDAQKSRGALLGLLDEVNSYPPGVRDVVQKMRDGIFEPLARKLLKLPEGKRWWELHSDQKKAVVGWFDCVRTTPETQAQDFSAYFASQKVEAGPAT